MRYKYRALIFSHQKKIIKFLKKNNREFEEDKSINMGVYYFYEDDPLFSNLKKTMHEEGVIWTITTEYNLEEMSTAKWLSVRSKWLNGYPESENYIDQIYNISRKNECICNRTQISNIHISKDIKWGAKRYFCSINGLLDELIVNISIVSMLEKSGLKGFSFRDLEVKSSISQTAKQLVVKNYMVDELDIRNVCVETVKECIFCKCKKIIMSGKEEHYYKEAFEKINVDILKSRSLFGEAGFKQIYISQKFYNFLIDNKLDKNLVFEPISLD